MKGKPRFFSLIEVLLVLFLTSLIGTVLVVFGKRAYDQQRFFNETSQLVAHFQLAQEMMVLLQADVDFVFEKNEKGTWSYRIAIEKPLAVFVPQEGEKNGGFFDPNLSKKWLQLVERKTPLYAIDTLFFSNESTQNRTQDKEEVTIQFHIGRMSEGSLILKKTGAHPEMQELYFPGYPALIKTKNQKNLSSNNQGPFYESSALYPFPQNN